MAPAVLLNTPRPGPRRHNSMATTTIAHPAHPSTRELRGIALYRDHADEIRFEDGTWIVPSQHDATAGYEVTLGRHGESCECRDFEFRGGQGPCAHIYAAIVARAKSAPCSSCGRRFRDRELVEVTEDQESLTWFVGDKLCRRDCAGPGGVF
jgi:SWIM zinc finger